jgi:DNA-binding CsgD family transcriptional regulator
MIAAAEKRGSAGLIERSAELRMLSQALESAASGMGTLVAVRGAAGIGKSTLLGAAAVMASRRELTVLRARGGELEREIPFGMALQLLERVVGELPADERGRAFEGAAGMAERLFDRSGPAGSGEPSLLHGLYWLAANLAERRPLALLVDDAHWADRSSLTWMLYLAQRIEELPIALILGFRGREPGAEHDLLARMAAHPAARTLEPAALTEQAVERLVRERMADADAEFCLACRTATGGNPFLLRELLAQVQHDGMEPAAAEAPAVARLAPEAVLDSVLERLRRMSGAAMSLARALAVLDHDGQLRHAAALAGLPLGAAVEAADELAWAEILAPDEPLAFVHPLVRSAIYADVPAATRADLHLRAARLLVDEGAPGDRVVAQLLPARPDGWLEAVAALRAGAERALAGGAPRTAAACLRRALAEPPAVGERTEILVALAGAAAAAGEESAAAVYAEALEAVDSGPRRAALAQALARTLAAHGRTREAGDALDAALAALGPGEEHLELGLQAAWAGISRGAVEMRAEAARRLRVVVERVGSQPSCPERMMLAQLAMEKVFAGEPRGEAVRLARLAWGDGTLLERETADGVGWIVALSALGWADHIVEFERGFAAGLADARRRGSVLAFANCSYGLVFGRYYTGRLADAVADAHHALDAERYGWREYVVACRAQLAWVHVERDELDEAERVIAPVEADPGRGSLPAYALALDARARIALARGDAAGAFAAAREAGRLMDESHLRNPAVLPWASHAALAAARLGRRDEARELAARELAAARTFGAPRAVGIALRTSGLVAGGDDGVALLEEAVAVLERSPAQLEHARALIDLGAELRRLRRRAAARGPLERGLEQAHEFGAFALARRAQADLAAVGGRPRSRAGGGADALTPAERRVARMAAAGMSNRELAEALFVTVKAVEWHLRNVYRKLGIAGRGELRRALGPGEAAVD